ncbi:MAG: glycosyl hydrolase, partial [Acidobacteriota bacterium]|nr:glycosyl hydrolase [Acidobacteriota bacterium]
TESIVIDAAAPATPFPHYWERMFGSGRAVLTLRSSYRQDLHEVKGITGFEYVRFHDILDDDMGVYSEDAGGKPVYNFSYVDQVYDGLLQAGVKPFVELSFTPRKLSVDPPTLHPFWYRPIVSPPRDYARWGELVYQFTRHLVERYGVDEVAQWYFEVWNEPNIDFWAGDPKESTYYQLYEHAAHAIKRVSPRLRVGGPATAQAAWVDRFIRHCVENKVPFDFVSTHVYGNDLSRDVFGTDENIPRDQMVCRAVRKVHDQVKASSRPDVPLIWSEYNASYKNEVEVTDSTYMAPWLADTIRQCDGLVDMLSYWTFSDVFDEQGVVPRPFYGGFGLVATGGVPKPAYNAFALLHRLGSKRIAVANDSALVTLRDNGGLVIALWNLAPPGESRPAKQFKLKITGLKGKRRIVMHQIDDQHGSFWPAYKRLGEPRYPTAEQYRELRKAAAMSPAPARDWDGGVLDLTLPAHALALVEIEAAVSRPSPAAARHTRDE